jgi:hypothetical protein
MIYCTYYAYAQCVQLLLYKVCCLIITVYRYMYKRHDKRMFIVDNTSG